MRATGHIFAGVSVLANVIGFTEFLPSKVLNLVIGSLGLMFPDVLEMKIIPMLTLGRVKAWMDVRRNSKGELVLNTGRERGVFYFRHRGIFHDVGYYFLVWLVMFLWDWLSPWRVGVVGGVVIWRHVFFLGALVHLLLDMGSVSGVPVFGKVLSLDLYRVGETSEKVAVLVICSVMGGILAARFDAESFFLVWSNWVSGITLKKALAGLGGAVFFGVAVVVGIILILYLRFRSSVLGRIGSGSGDSAGGVESEFNMMELVRNYRYGGGVCEADSAGSGDGCDAGAEVVGKSADEVHSGQGRGADRGVGGIDFGGLGLEKSRSVDFLKKVLETAAKTDEKKFGVLVETLKLLEAHGDISSVHGEDRGTDVTYDVLSRVSLYDHGLDTALEGLEVLRKEYNDVVDDVLVFRVVLACLLHDIGKADKLFGEQDIYNTGDHIVRGARFVIEFLGNTCGLGDDEVSVIAEAVRNHHQKVHDRDTHEPVRVILYRADRLARAGEYNALMKQEKEEKKETEKEGQEGDTFEKNEKKEVFLREGGEGIVLPDIGDDVPACFSHGKLIEVLRECANFPKETRATELNEWRAFSGGDGYVYFKLDYLSSLIAEVAGESGCKEYWMVSDDEESGERRLKAFCRYWRGKGFLHEAIREGFFSQQFEVLDKITRKKFPIRLIALKVEMLGVSVSELEVERRRYPRLYNLEVLGIRGREKKEDGQGGI